MVAKYAKNRQHVRIKGGTYTSRHFQQVAVESPIVYLIYSNVCRAVEAAYIAAVYVDTQVPTFVKRPAHYVDSAVYAICLCLSVSVTSRGSTKMARHGITQTIPHDSPKTLVFWCRRSPRNPTSVNPCGCAKCKCGRLKSAKFDK